MKRQNKYFFTVIFVMVFLAVTASAQSVKKGTLAPDFSLTLPDGKAVNPASYRGKALLLHFWATWCPPCRAELPEMNKLAEKLASETDSKLAFLAVCVSDSEKSRSAFMKKNNYTFTGGLDASGAIAKKYGVFGIPASFLISPDGKIEDVFVGAMTPEKLASFVSAYEK